MSRTRDLSGPRSPPQLGARRIHLLDVGSPSSPAVLLLHGLGSVAQEIFAPLAEPFLRAGHRVLAPDRPGYGFSDPAPPDEMGPSSQSRWLAALLETLDVDVAVVVAHSFGAAVGLCLARRLNAKLRGLVLINPFCRPTRPAAMPLMRLATAPFIGSLVRRQAIPIMAKPLVRWHLAQACAPDPLPRSLSDLPPSLLTRESALFSMAAELRGFNADIAWLVDDGASLDVPTSVLAGLKDRVVCAEHHGDWLRQRLVGAEFATVKTGHMLHHMRPDLVVQAVENVLLPGESSTPARPA